MTKPGTILHVALTDCNALDAELRRVLISSGHRGRFDYGEVYTVLAPRLTLTHGEARWYVQIEAGDSSEVYS